MIVKQRTISKSLDSFVTSLFTKRKEQIGSLSKTYEQDF